MNEGDLYCNARKCHRVLNTSAWVTFCSHIFCEEDGIAHLSQIPCACPACGAPLASKSDIMRVDLDPPEQFRNMILAGFKPDIIMDICSRALNFWSYQMDKERQRQLKRVQLLESQMTELEEFYEKILRDINAEISAAKRQLDSARKEQGEVLQQKDILSEKLGDKSRQFQKLKNLYDSLRRRVNLPMENHDSALRQGGRLPGPSQYAMVPYGQIPHPSQNFVRDQRNQFPASAPSSFSDYNPGPPHPQQQQRIHEAPPLPSQNFRASPSNFSRQMVNHGGQNIMQLPMPKLASNGILSQAITQPPMGNYNVPRQSFPKAHVEPRDFQVKSFIPVSQQSISDFKFQPKCRSEQ